MKREGNKKMLRRRFLANIMTESYPLLRAEIFLRTNKKLCQYAIYRLFKELKKLKSVSINHLTWHTCHIIYSASGVDALITIPALIQLERYSWAEQYCAKNWIPLLPGNSTYKPRALGGTKCISICSFCQIIMKVAPADNTKTSNIIIIPRKGKRA